MNNIDKELKSAKELNKEVLGDVGKDIVEIEKELLSDAEIKNMAADVELFYNKHFKKILALKEYEWLMSLGTNAETSGQVIWHRGALRALQEIKEWFQVKVNLSLSRHDKDEEDEEI